MILILSEYSRGLSQQTVWLRTERKIATKTRGVLARVYCEVGPLSATRAGVYLNLKLGNRSWAAPSRASLDFAIIFFLSLSLSFPLVIPPFPTFPPLLPDDPPTRSFLAPLIPASCRSSLRPARPSKNSLTCLGVAYPFLLFPLILFSFTHYRVTLCARTTSKRRSIGKLVVAVRRSVECFERKRKVFSEDLRLGKIKPWQCVFNFSRCLHINTYSKIDYHEKLLFNAILSF